MTRVIADISVSLDGYVTGPAPGPDNGLGDGGERLHDWVFDGTATDREILDSGADATGAIVLGRRLFDVVDGPHGWQGDLGYGGQRDQSAPPHGFVVTHAEPAAVRLVDRFTIVTDGIESAVEQARQAAGGREVVIMGGAGVIRSALDAELVDVLSLHLAPVLLGGGTPLFLEGRTRRLELESATSTPFAQHLTYRVLR